jgi:branched-chain amino acid transport system permease protein
MELLLQLGFFGLAKGSLYALIAISFALIFFVTQTLHIAHGTVFVVAAYSFYFFSSILSLPWIYSVFLSFPVASILGASIELGIYRPLRRKYASPLILFLSSIAILFGAPGVLAMIFGSEPIILQVVPKKTFIIGVIAFTNVHLVMLSLWLLIGLFILYLRRSRTGRIMRAVADRPLVAVVVGIDTSKVNLMAMAIGSALMVPAAILWGIDQLIDPGIGIMPILMGASGMILGGMGNILGAALGGMIIGLAMNLGVLYISTGWQEGIALAVLVLVLVLRPEGIFGTRIKW